jgi:hypothetical protein
MHGDDSVATGRCGTAQYAYPTALVTAALAAGQTRCARRWVGKSGPRIALTSAAFVIGTLG